MVITFAIALSMSCADRDRAGNLLDVPTSGRIRIAADGSLKPVIAAIVQSFEHTYPDAHITVTYESESDAIKDLANDSVHLVALTRTLKTEEESLIESKHLFASSVLIAHEGLALISNPAVTDTSFSIQEIKDLLTKGKSPSVLRMPPSIAVVFDYPNSGMARYLEDSLASPDSLGPACFALRGDSAVIRYVALVKNTFGFIGSSWIVDRGDSTLMAFTNSIKVIPVRTDSGSFLPFQAFVAQGSYPLIRPVILVNDDPRTGLASGLTAFAAGDKGQRIVLKAGLVPATMPVRIVQVQPQIK